MRGYWVTSIAAGVALTVTAAGPALAARGPARHHPPRSVAQTAAPDAAADRYPNGRIPASALCPIGQPGQMLRCDAARDWRRLAAAYRVHFGVPLLVTDSYRSYAAQVSCRERKGDLCAVPGTSNHGRGLAVDLAGPAHLYGTAEHAWLERYGAAYGWVWPPWAHPNGAKPEPWHWQYRTTS
jgi:hypothetical protein